MTIIHLQFQKSSYPKFVNEAASTPMHMEDVVVSEPCKTCVCGTLSAEVELLRTENASLKKGNLECKLRIAELEKDLVVFKVRECRSCFINFFGDHFLLLGNYSTATNFAKRNKELEKTLATQVLLVCLVKGIPSILCFFRSLI